VSHSTSCRGGIGAVCACRRLSNRSIGPVNCSGARSTLSTISFRAHHYRGVRYAC
jgi:hypothetical protein